MPIAYEDYFAEEAASAAAVPYIPGSLQLSSPYIIEGTVYGNANHDHLTPFIPRTDVTIDGVVWRRSLTGAANVYVGLFDSAGQLLTDCAVDANTTAGLRAVGTTPIALVAGNLYYIGINQSDAILSTHRLSSVQVAQTAWLARYGILAGLGATSAGSVSKARTNAAFPSTIDLTGYSNLTNDAALVAGVRVQA